MHRALQASVQAAKPPKALYLLQTTAPGTEGSPNSIAFAKNNCLVDVEQAVPAPCRVELQAMPHAARQYAAVSVQGGHVVAPQEATHETRNCRDNNCPRSQHA
jgi:hypothetical protein